MVGKKDRIWPIYKQRIFLRLNEPDSNRIMMLPVGTGTVTYTGRHCPGRGMERVLMYEHKIAGTTASTSSSILPRFVTV